VAEASDEMEGKPIIDAALASKIASTLGLEDPGVVKRLTKRLQRYSDRYYFRGRRTKNAANVGDVRKFAREIVNQIAKLQRDVNAITFSDHFASAYRAERRSSEEQRRPSLEAFSQEVRAMTSVCQRIIDGPPHPRGRKGNPVLRQTVGALMALFETIAGERPRHAASHEGVKGDYLIGKGGVALREFFERLDPDVAEGTLARYVGQFEEEYGEDPMTEGDFDFISGIEDAGEISFIDLRYQ